MKHSHLFLLVVSTFFLSLTASAKLVFSSGFESYAAGSNINGQAIGSTAWSTSGAIAGDIAAISTDTAYEGGNSLLVADNGANRPRVSVNFVTGGFIASAVTAGSVSFAIREDSGDAGAGDSFTVNVGNMTLSHTGTTSSLYFAITGGGNKTMNFTGTGYAYTAGAWNLIRIDFDDVAKSASIFINGGLAGTITGAAATFSVSSITLGTYASGATGDKLYFDALTLSQTGYQFLANFEGYTAGANISGQTVGATTWAASGVIAGDQAIVSTDYAKDGTKSLLLADNGSNRPRATVNFVTGGFIPAAATGGTLSFALLEDPADSGANDSYTINLSNSVGSMAISRGGSVVVFSVTGGGYQLSLPLNTQAYTYTPGQWNTFKVEFDNTAKTASIYINGGYAGTLAAPAADFSVSSATFGTYSSGAVADKIYVDSIAGDFNGAEQAFEWRSALYPSNWTPGYADADGHFVQDFSYAGYHRGEIPVPTITSPVFNVVTGYSADATGATDSTVAIQNAIDAATTAGGGVVYLPAGTYKVSPQGSNIYALKIGSSNIVFRGAGTGSTFLYNSNPVMRGKVVILAQPAGVAAEGGSASPDWYNGTTTAAATSDLPIGSTSIPVASTTGFAVGDFVGVRNDLTQALIDELGMHGVSGWTSPGAFNYGKELTFARRITSIAAGQINVDVPLRYELKTRDNARVVKLSVLPITEIGLENFSIGMAEVVGTLGDNDYTVVGTGGYNAHGAAAITIRDAENCWVSHVSTYKPAGNAMFHLVSNGLRLTTSRQVTVDSCDFRLAQYKGGGGNGYLFILSGQEALFNSCHAESGRHNFSFDYAFASGNVLYNLYDKASQNDSDFHQFFSVSNLVDNTTCDAEMLETRYRSEVTNPVPGWTSAQTVFWNTKGLSYSGHSTDGTTALRIISSYQYNQEGYIIGTQGSAYAVTTTDYVEGVGKSSQLIPASLYLDQRQKRLGF